MGLCERWAVVLVTGFCVVSLAMVPALAGASTATTHPKPVGQTDQPVIDVEYRVRVDGVPAESVRVVVSIDAPASVDRVELALPDEHTVLDVEGVDRTEPGTYETEAHHASITYLVPVSNGNDSANSQSYSIRGEDWAFIDLDTIRADLRWWYTDRQPRATVDISTEEGVAADDVALLGNVSSEQVGSDGSGPAVTVVSLSEYPPSISPNGIASMIRETETRHRVGEGPNEIHVFSIPTPYGGPPGFFGGSSIAIRHDAFSSGVLVHEYVHAKQRYSTSTSMEWLVEAESTYYESLYPAYWGMISERSFRERLSVDDSEERSRSLEDSTGGPNDVGYTKGAVVLGALDREIRQATKGNHTLKDVLRRVNRGSGTLTYDRFRSAVVAVGGETLGPWVDRHVAESRYPRPPGSLAAVPKPGWSASNEGLVICRRGEVVPGTGPVAVRAGTVLTVVHSEYGEVDIEPAVERRPGDDACPNSPLNVAIPRAEYETFAVRENTTLRLTDRHDGSIARRTVSMYVPDESSPPDQAENTTSSTAMKPNEEVPNSEQEGRDSRVPPEEQSRIGSLVFTGRRMAGVLLGLRGWPLVILLATIGTMSAILLHPDRGEH